METAVKEEQHKLVGFGRNLLKIQAYGWSLPSLLVRWGLRDASLSLSYQLVTFFWPNSTKSDIHIAVLLVAWKSATGYRKETLLLCFPPPSHSPSPFGREMLKANLYWRVRTSMWENRSLHLFRHQGIWPLDTTHRKPSLISSAAHRTVFLM